MRCKSEKGYKGMSSRTFLFLATLECLGLRIEILVEETRPGGRQRTDNLKYRETLTVTKTSPIPLYVATAFTPTIQREKTIMMGIWEA